MTLNPILKLNLDEYTKEELTRLSLLLSQLGRLKEVAKIEYYIKEQGLT